VIKPPSTTLRSPGSIQPLSNPIQPEAPCQSSNDPQELEDSWQEEDLDRSPNYRNLDGNYMPVVRFDLPSPIQLETRGVTGQTVSKSWAADHPETQASFWSNHTIQKMTVAAKLRETGDIVRAQTLEACHSTWTRATCGDCGRVQTFPNRCDSFFCPECQTRLAHEREKSISWWAAEISQPKFITLTCKNIPELTIDHIVEFKGWWTRLRHRSFAKNWRGGFYSLEVTNRGRGWHLHIHALVDAHWIDAPGLAREWDSVTRGCGHIVKVKDARGKEYLDRVKSYIVKPEELAAWPAERIKTFVHAFSEVRTFGVFGSLYGKRTQFAAWLAELKEAKPRCPCGSCNVTYQSETEALMNELRDGLNSTTRPPPAPTTHDLFFSKTGCAAQLPR
jgi:hypothetical protein